MIIQPNKGDRSMLNRTLLTFALLIAGLPTAFSLAAQAKPLSPVELALYQGKDREKILLEGARKEGQVVFYTSNTWVAGPVRRSSKEISFRQGQRLAATQSAVEAAHGGDRREPNIADVVETSPEYMAIMLREKMLHEHFSPELSAYDDEAKLKGKNGVYGWSNREIYISLGYNSKVIAPADAPKSVKDYLDPKWKGKMSIAGTTTGTQWIGALLELMGREFLDKLSAQEINVQNISGAALSGLVASGEVPLSPTIFNSNILTHKQKGAPVEWRPGPVIAGVSISGMVLGSPHPMPRCYFSTTFIPRKGSRSP
jgi:iron(III) transport system substrate-binding protein